MLGKIGPLDAHAQSRSSSLIRGGQKHGCNHRLVPHHGDKLVRGSNADGVGIDQPSVAQAPIVVPHGRQVPFGETVFPRSRVRQIKGVTLNNTVLNPLPGKLCMELERY